MMSRHGASIFQTAINALSRTLGLALVVTSCDAQPALNARSTAGLVTSSHAKKIDLSNASVTSDARDIAAWVIGSGDSQGLPFVVIDKKAAKAFVFYADGRLRGATPVLLGSAIGDSSAPGVGQKKLSDIRADERTTPAGRFVASLDRNIQGGEILWVDYETAISLHPVVTSNVREQRAQRLATVTPLDNRISYGCINVPINFFATVIKPAFSRSNGIVYILPETQSAQKLFGMNAVAPR